MGHSYAWKGGNGSLALAADWIDESTGQTALAAPGAADGATLAGAASGLLLATGALDVASLVTSLGVALGGHVTAGTLAAAGTLVLDPGATLDAATATVSGALAAVGAGAAAQVSGTLTLSGAATATGGGTLAAGALALAGGTLSVDALSSAAIGGGAAASGTIAVRAGAAIVGDGALDAGGIALAGTIAAAGGALGLFGAVAGSGTLSIGAGATLFAADAVGSGLTAAFAAPTSGAGGTLELLGAGASFGATIAGFAPGDAIEIAGDAIKTAAWANGVLTLTDTAGTALPLALPDGGGQNYETGLFVPVPDGLGGTAVLLAPAAIAPPEGNVTYTVPAGAFQTFTAVAALGHIVVAGTLVAEHLAINTISVTGTLVAAGGNGAFDCPSAAVSGLVVAIGPRMTASVKGDLVLSGTLAAEAGGLDAVGTLTLAGGALTVDPASAMTLGSATAEAGRIALAAGATLAGFGRIDASLDDAGLLLVQGGLLRLDAPVTGAGAVQIGGGGTLAVFGTLALPVTFAAAATLQLIGSASLVTGPLSGFVAGDALDIADMAIGSAAWSGGTLSLSAGGTVVEALALAGTYGGKTWQTASDGAGGTLVSLGTGGGGQPLFVTGTLAVATAIEAPSATADSGALIAMQGGTLAVGALRLLAGATLSGEGVVGGTLAVAGGVTASGGALVVAGPISGAGTLAIAATGTLFAEAGFAGATPVAFQGEGGTLDLFASANAAPGPISGFASGDGLDILAADVTGAAWAATGGGLGTLDLTGPAGSLGSFLLVGNYAGASFIAHPDGSGGAVVALAGGSGGGSEVPCFLAGTRIATPEGTCAVEALRPGDRVLTPAGPRRLRWVGRRDCDTRVQPEARPVRIAAGALFPLLGAKLPTADLLVSPQHALLLRGVLVPAVALVGAAGIRRESTVGIVYFHVGLEPHATVLAEGVPAETFLPLAAAARFDAEFGERPQPGASCAPRLEGGPALVALRRLLLPRLRRASSPGALRGHVERATAFPGTTRLEGWALDDAAPARPVRLDVLRDGARVGVAVANRWRPDLDRAGLAGGSCAFALDVRGAGPFRLCRRTDGAELPALVP